MHHVLKNMTRITTVSIKKKEVWCAMTRATVNVKSRFTFKLPGPKDAVKPTKNKENEK